MLAQVVKSSAGPKSFESFRSGDDRAGERSYCDHERHTAEPLQIGRPVGFYA